MSPRTPSDAPGSGGAAGGDDVLHGRHVILCVTGGIAAYKSAYLTRALVKAGAQVVVMMTEAAQRFVAPLTFETLSGNRVVTSTFERAFEMGAVEHIDLATWADLVVVAPATYNFIGKLNAGIADDAVTTSMSAVTCPMFIAPAMNEHMWRNPINQRNVEALRTLGYRIIDPERGGLACSWEGDGRMRDPEDILSIVRRDLPGAARAMRDTTRAPDLQPGPATPGDPGRSSAAPGSSPAKPAGSAPAGDAAPDAAPLAGRTVLVTAAGTWEPLDPVRFIGNRSSGRMGYALARAARQRGARVLLVSGPSALTVPEGLAGFRGVETAQDMLDVCREWLAETDVLLMAAAVADYRPRKPAGEKIRRRSGALDVELEPTPDVLATLREGKGERLFVGFALETEEPQRSAQEKLVSKGLDLIVANRVGDTTGPDTDTNQVWIYDKAGLVQETALLDKPAIADIILDVVERQLVGKKHIAKT